LGVGKRQSVRGGAPIGGDGAGRVEHETARGEGRVRNG